MGTDIHLFAEKFKQGRWGEIDLKERYNPERYYQLFNILAGVREEICRKRGYESHPISEPRGFPVDVSDSIFKNHDPCDTHSVSWLYLYELENNPYLSDPDFSKTFYKIILELKEYSKNPCGNDVRIVFWFDC
jgi:hypothetical protein